jgi:hypothetical protein
MGKNKTDDHEIFEKHLEHEQIKQDDEGPVPIKEKELNKDRDKS